MKEDQANHQTHAAELRSIAGRIEEWRAGRGLSKNQLCQRFGQLGSTKTYGRILDAADDLGELNVTNQIENYQAAWELIQAWKEDPEQSRIYSDLGAAPDLFSALRKALAAEEDDNTRLIVVIGQSGSGKSTLLKLMEQTRWTGSIMHHVEATEAWRESTNELLGALLSEVGMFHRAPSDPDKRTPREPQRLPPSPGDRYRMLISRLGGSKVILAIDEAHHIGPKGYNIVKSIINETRAVVVMFAIPGLLTRINRHSHEEARQLFSNRLLCYVYALPPEPGECMEFMKRRGLKFANSTDANAICAKVSADAVSYGSWKYMVRCIREARKQAEALTAEAFAGVIAKVKRSISLGA